MKVLVIGCGSIGTRHITNLIRLGMEVLAYDTDNNRLKTLRKISQRILVSSKLNPFWKLKPQVAFITTPTVLHVPHALNAARHGCHLFIEKPLSDNLRNIKMLQRIVREKKLHTLVGCNMRFHWAIAQIKRLLEEKSLGMVYAAHIDCGYYLPDWRINHDYRQTYSAQKRLGGGVILDIIHELDYARWFFGEVKKGIGLCEKMSNLQIDTEDIADIILKFKTTPLVTIHLDYLQRRYSRGCKIICEKGTIQWDINRHKVEIYSARKNNQKNINESDNYQMNDMYLEEVRYFFNRIKKGRKMENDLDFALNTLRLALAIKNHGTYDSK